MIGRAISCVSVFLATLVVPCAAQKFDYNQEAEFDDKGNIFVSSSQGKLIWMANTRHCAEAMVANDKQTVGCMVAPPATFPPAPARQVEIYLKGGEKRSIEPGAPIVEWHFWEDGAKVAMHSGSQSQRGVYELYESATGRLLENVVEPPDDKLLPQWAKSQAQIEDEAVPMSGALAEERTHWIAKVLRQIEKIEPGARRRDLAGILTTEGGLSNRFQQTYVYVECPYIKVKIKFRPASNGSNALEEDPEDTIESISRPYLEWSIAD